MGKVGATGPQMPAELSSIGLPYFHYGPASTQIGIWLLTAISPQIKVSKTRESLDLFPNPKVPEKGSDYLDRVRCQPGTSQPQSQSQSQDWRHHNTTWCRHCFQNRGNCCGGVPVLKIFPVTPSTWTNRTVSWPVLPPPAFPPPIQLPH